MSKQQGKDIWTLIKQNKDPSFFKQSQEEHEKHVVFVGNRRSGKTTLIRQFLNRGKPLSKEPAPTIALDYVFDKRESKLHRYNCHIWELAGGKSLLSLLKEVVHMGNIHNTLFVIVLDLSKPKSLFNDLTMFLRNYETLAFAVYDQIKKQNNSTLPKKLVERQQKKFKFENHSDKENNIRFSGVSTLVVANKFDIFQRDEPKRVRLVSRCLRFLCHLHSASLVYSGKGEFIGVNDILGNLIFGTRLDEKKFIKMKNELESIRILCGRDSLANLKKMTIQKRYKRIELEGVNDKKILAWYSDFASFFGKVEEEEKEEESFNIELEKYVEPQIDKVRKRMDEQYHSLKKNLERERRTREKKKSEKEVSIV